MLSYFDINIDISEDVISIIEEIEELKKVGIKIIDEIEIKLILEDKRFLKQQIERLTK